MGEKTSTGFFTPSISAHLFLTLYRSLLSGFSCSQAAMGQLQEKVKSKMSRPRYNHVLVVKGAMLIHAHLMRVPLPPNYSAQLLQVLKQSGRMLTAMVGSCRERQYLKQAIAVIKFEQMLVQAMWQGDDEVASQMPHVTANMVKVRGGVLIVKPRWWK